MPHKLRGHQAWHAFGDPKAITYSNALNMLTEKSDEDSAISYISACILANTILADFMKREGWNDE
jgi:hypothetical protein